jgi:hypothetical protein
MQPTLEYEPVPREPRPPGVLRVVGLAFVVMGFLDIIRSAGVLYHDGCSPPVVGILSFFIADGLLNLSRGWRTCALAVLWFEMITFGGALAIMLVSPDPSVVQVGGATRLPEDIDAWLDIGTCVLFLIVAGWQYWVLTRPEIRRLFVAPRLAPEETRPVEYDLKPVTDDPSADDT